MRSERDWAVRFLVTFGLLSNVASFVLGMAIMGR